MSLVHLRRGGVGLLLETYDDRLPAIGHWGADLGSGEFGTVGPALTGVRVPSGFD